jgi:hypothetical protein
LPVAFFSSIGLAGQPDGKTPAAAFLLTLLIVFNGGFFIRFFCRFNFRSRTALFTAVPLANYSEFGLIVAAVEQLHGAGYKGFLAATARFEDQVEELREMGVHSVYNVFANVGSAYADYVRRDIAQHPVFSVRFKDEMEKTAA